MDEQMALGVTVERSVFTDYRLAQMHRVYGERADAQCGGCRYLRRAGHRTYFKCERFGMTQSRATDWRARWRACGLFEEGEV